MDHPVFNANNASFKIMKEAMEGFSMFQLTHEFCLKTANFFTITPNRMGLLGSLLGITNKNQCLKIVIFNTTIVTTKVFYW